MANVRTLQRSFNGGELTAEMFGQIGDAKFQTGSAICRNFIVLPHGPVTNRPGFAFVREVKDSTKKVRLIPFTYSSTQTMVIEIGPGYFRFHTQGGTLLSGNAPYEVANNYAEADIFDIHYVQSADVLTMVHPNYPPAELRRLGATNWTLTNIQFASTLVAPTGITATATGTGTTVYKYVVTAVGNNGIDESVASAVAQCTGNLYATGAKNDISWGAVAGAQRYKVYKFWGGLYGYIGQTDGLTFTDDNITSDMSSTPPIVNNPFGSATNYPGAVSYFEQRRVFAGTESKPQNIWMTKSGTESNLNYSLPTRDDDAINFRVAAREANTIRHIVPLTNMVLLTSSAEWRITSLNSDAITPTTISVRPQSYVGASNVQPVIINNNLIYAAARGGHIRELAYSWQANGYITGDLSIRAPHLFDNKNIMDLAYSKAPNPIVWMVSSDGRLLGLTYVPEQQVGAWHRHDTDGLFETCCVVAEGNEDVLYVIVRRTINGVQRRYIERMASRAWATQADAFYVDSGATLNSQTPITTVSGLSWLEGKTVAILTDGAVHRNMVVTNGQVTLDYSAYKVQIGLPITSDILTLPWTSQIDQALGQGRIKNVNKVWLRVNQSGAVFVGPDENHLTEYKQRTTENYGQATSLISKEILIPISPTWNDAGQVFVRQSHPLPITLVSMSMEVAVGA